MPQAEKFRLASILNEKYLKAYERDFIEAVNVGLEDIAQGRVYPALEVFKHRVEGELEAHEKSHQ